MSRLTARHPLARDLSIVLVIKFAVILLAANFLFGDSQRVHLDSDRIAAHIFGPEQ